MEPSVVQVPVTEELPEAGAGAGGAGTGAEGAGAGAGAEAGGGFVFPVLSVDRVGLGVEDAVMVMRVRRVLVWMGAEAGADGVGGAAEGC